MKRVVIIGSGIGGLSIGIILAGLGFSVTVVEKNRQPGGMMRSYVRRGVHCNVGLHYLGALDEGQVLRRCFDYLGLSTDLPLTRMGVNGPIDRYLFTDAHPGLDSFDVPAGFAAYEANLRAAFPGQQSQIDTLMGLLRRSARQFSQLDFLYAERPTHSSWLEEMEPLGAIFERIGCSPGLRAVFGLPSVLIGVPPALCPQFYHTMALASYLLSAWRLNSNGAHLADLCVQRLTALGGLVRSGEAVAEIRTKEGSIQGVTLASGEIVAADLVIGTSHPGEILRLLSLSDLKPSYRRRLQTLRNTKGMTAVHALVPADRHPAIAHNLFAIQTEANGDARDLLYLQLRPSEKAGQNLLSLITSGHEERWEPWSHTVSGRRGAGYLKSKMEFANRLIGQAEKISGPFSDIRLLDVSTPLTIRDWVNSPNGSAYGVMRSTEQLLSGAMLNRGSLRGLFWAGQSVMAPGILGTIIGSLATVQFIVGPERFRQEVRI